MRERDTHRGNRWKKSPSIETISLNGIFQTMNLFSFHCELTCRLLQMSGYAPYHAQVCCNLFIYFIHRNQIEFEIHWIEIPTISLKVNIEYKEIWSKKWTVVSVSLIFSEEQDMNNHFLYINLLQTLLPGNVIGLDRLRLWAR